MGGARVHFGFEVEGVALRVGEEVGYGMIAAIEAEMTATSVATEIVEMRGRRSGMKEAVIVGTAGIVEIEIGGIAETIGAILFEAGDLRLHRSDLAPLIMVLATVLATVERLSETALEKAPAMVPGMALEMFLRI